MSPLSCEDKVKIPPVAGRTTPVQSLFVYPLGTDHGTYQDTSFTPTFITDDMLDDSGTATCGSNLQCLYDLAVTNNIAFALNTRNTVMEFRELADMFAEGMLQRIWGMPGLLIMGCRGHKMGQDK